MTFDLTCKLYQLCTLNKALQRFHSYLTNASRVTRQLVSKLPHVTVPFLGQELTPASSAKDLGIILDWNLNFTEHISTLPSTVLSSSCQISRVRHLFTKDALNIILNYLIFSKLFYCSTIWPGTFKQNIKKLQLTQNFAARILTDTRKYDHIFPIPHELGWFTVKKPLRLRDTIMIYKCLNGLTPRSLSSNLSERSKTYEYNTRNPDQLSLHKCRTEIAQRSFFDRAVASWNSLTGQTRSSKSIQCFKKKARVEISCA